MLSSLAILPLSSLSHAQDAQNVKINNSLTTAIQQVDTDGEYLKLEKASDLMEKIATAVDKYFLPLARKQADDFPSGFSFTKALEITGLNEITASSKSIKKQGKNYLTKSFIQTNGSRKGLLSILGKADQPWASLEYAPSNTALLLETHLDFSNVPQIMREIAPLLDQEIAKQMLATLSEKDPVAGNTVEQILTKADARISCILELDKTKTWSADGVEASAIHATGRIDGIAKFIWEHYGETLTQMIPMQSKGNVHTIFIPKQIDAPWGKLTPVIIMDVDNNHIWLSLSAEHLASCQEGKTKLTDNQGFQHVNKHNRKEGATRAYISKQALSIFFDVAKRGLDKAEARDPARDDVVKQATKKAFDTFFEYTKSLDCISTCISHDDKGMHVHTHAPFPLKQSDQLNGISYISALAGLSYGPIMKQLEAADRVEAISNMRSINTALLGFYAANKAQYPDNLQQLVKAGLITGDLLELPNRELHYVKGWDASDGAKIIMYTSADEEGKAIAAYVDGAVQAISEAQLKEELKKQ